MDQTIQRVVSEGLATPAASLDLQHLPNLRVYFEGFLDQERLKTDLASYAIWASTNSAPVLQGGFLHRPPGTNMLVAAIWSCKKLGDDTTRASEFAASCRRKEVGPNSFRPCDA